MAGLLKRPGTASWTAILSDPFDSRKQCRKSTFVRILQDGKDEAQTRKEAQAVADGYEAVYRARISYTEQAVIFSQQAGVDFDERRAFRKRLNTLRSLAPSSTENKKKPCTSSRSTRGRTSYPTLELRTPSGQRLSLEARPYSWQLMCVDNMPQDVPAVTHLSFRKEQLDALVDFIRRMRTPEACKPAHTCIQCAYCDMWDMTCANIDNADKELNRMPILSDTPACKYFTPEKL